jgi:hypothetical protein
MAYDKNLDRIYGDRTYVSTTMVRHAGTTVAFAMDASRRIFYSVLNLDLEEASRGPLDVAYWNAEPGLLTFPGEIVDVMPPVTTSIVLPTVERGTRTETQPDLLAADEVDQFLSTTARLTAATRLQVVSDGRYLYVFRQSIAATDGDAIFKLTGGGWSGNPSRNDYAQSTSAGAPKIAAADSSLLCDRYVLGGSQLFPVVEVRYQRSRSKFAPASGGDTMGTRDMEGKFFYEPTLKLSFVSNLTGGQFCATQLPTAVSGQARWQVFAFNSATSRVESFNLPTDSDGLFSVTGQQLYTSPDPKYQPSVLERSPGIDFNTKQPLIPVPPSTDRAGTALHFDGSAGGLTIAPYNRGDLPGDTQATLEAWIKPAALGGQIVAIGGGFSVYLDGNGMLAAGKDRWELKASSAVPAGVYSHVAAVYNSTSVTLLVNGTSVASSTTSPDIPILSANITVGAGFNGDIDEVRLWATARTRFDDRWRRLTGIEPNLCVYLRMDEGAGTTASDSTRWLRQGALAASPGPTWVSSDAPVGDGPGLSRDSFAVTGYLAATALATTMYFQQEPEGAPGYDDQPGQSKRQSRLLLAFGIAAQAQPGQSQQAQKAYVYTLDLAVTRHGRLAQVPAQLQPAGIAPSAPTTDQQAISAAQTVLAAAQAVLNADQALVNRMPATVKAYQDVEGSQELSSTELYRNWLAPQWRGDQIKWANQARANLADLANQYFQMLYAQVRLAADQAAVKAAQDKLATLTGGLSGGDEQALPMPLISTDRTGLASYGGMLSFAWTADAPTLLESSTGDVVLYLRGGDGQFFAAYYPTQVSRAVKTITTGNDKLSLIAHDTSASLSDITVAVIDGASADQCQVQIARGPVTETFGQVPRAAVTFANVLNGTLPPGPLAATALSTDDLVVKDQPVKDQTVKLADKLANALSSGTAITIGGVARRLSADAAADATTLTIASDARSYAYPRGGEVRTVTYDYGQQASCNVPGMSLARGSLIIGARAGTATGPVPTGTAADGTAALAPRWRGDSPGRALSFDGNAQGLRLASAAALPAIAPTADLTVEAWANPAFVGAGTTQGGRARIVHANIPAPAAGSPPSAQVAPYTLGLEGAPLTSALQFNGSTDYIDCGNNLSLAGTDFTVEMWVKRQASGHVDSLFQLQKVDSPGTVGIFLIALTAENTFGAAWVSSGNSQQVVTASTYPDTGWHHWAVTYVVASGQVTIYRDGAQVGQGTLSGAIPLAAGNTRLAGGATVALDEVRVWRRARTSQAINAYMNTRVSGEEPGLLAYWSFQNSSTIDRTGNHYDGVINGTPQQVTSGLPGSSLVAGVGSQFVRSADTFPVGQWGHVGLVFKQDWAMKLNGIGYIDAGGADGLNLLDDLTIEAFVQLDTLGVRHGLVAKGALGAGKKGNAVPYAFYVREDGALVFSFESGSGGSTTWQTFTSTDGATPAPGRLQAGVFTKVAVTRWRTPNDPAERYGITFYINGAVAGTSPVPPAIQVYSGAKPVGNDENCVIGQYGQGSTTFGLRGTLSEIRIWSVARSSSQIGAAIAARANGLAGWWNFPEARGASTADETGNYPATVRGATRVRTPDPAGNSLTLYRNGGSVASALVKADDPLATAGYGSTSQFTIAGNSGADGSLSEGFAGALDEIRIWRVARTQEQLLDNLFSRLRGERNDLLAYYPFDSSSTVLGAIVNDLGLRGNNLAPSTPAPTIGVSTAPVSDDTSQVRSALTTVMTPFNVLVGGTPMGSEYADMQRDGEGRLIGVMKRCYAYIRAGSWVLRTGFKIGDLVTSWVGQAQFNPQLIGYIEGAPPVPSENLIYDSGADYNDKSSVTFVQADKVSSTLGQTKAGTFDFAAKANFKVGFGTDVWTVTGVLAVAAIAGTAQPLAKVKGSVNAGFELKFSQGWSEDTQVHQETATTRTSAVSLTGHFEDAEAAKQVNPTAGRRFVPANYGFAIVQSATADLYALRLGHSGALVTYRMIANPDIPPDWNIITFQLNPAYCKQGTLDGLVGYAAAKGSGSALQPFADPDYPKAADADTAKGEFSYYRPSEAYALKRRIQREELQLQSFYDSVSTDTTLLGNNKVYQQAERVLNSMSGGGGGPGTSLDPATGNAVAGREANRSSSKRNLADTYVWTASGGLFSETTSTTDQVTWVTTGNYSVSGSTTIGGSIEFGAGPASMEISGDVSFGGSSTITRTKTRDASRSFSLGVVCQPSRNLLDADSKPVPGRVDAYRFISFYLDTSIDNYDDFYGKVIDPVWLASSSDPGAIALRQSRQPGRKPPCWRIFHRVTFVSRVLPTPPSAAAPTLQTAMSALNMASNNAMVLQIAPHLGTPVPATLDGLTTAATTAISTHFPKLAAYTTDIVNILAAYYSLT